MSRPLAHLLHPLDEVRLTLLRALGAWGRPFIRDRELRVLVVAILAVFCALVTTWSFPIGLLAWSPLALGVPHLLFDIRHLVLRPGLQQRVGLSLGLGATLMLVEGGWLVGGTLAAFTVVALVARGSVRRRVVVLAGVAACLLLTRGWLTQAALVLAHAHNMVAMGLWCFWRPRARRVHWLAFTLMLGGYVALLLGAADAFVWRSLQRSNLDGVAEQIGRLARDVPAPWDFRLVLAFAYAQSLHYAVWLRLIPEEDAERDTPRSFALSWRLLVRDCGPWLVVMSVVAGLALLVWAAASPRAAGMGYLRLALFHGPLELALLVLAWIEARRPGEPVRA